MGFYFVNIIHSNMLLLCVLIFIIGLINMNFSCKGAFGALWRIAGVYEGVTKQRMSGAMSGPWHWAWYVIRWRPRIHLHSVYQVLSQVSSQAPDTWWRFTFAFSFGPAKQRMSGDKSGPVSGAWLGAASSRGSFVILENLSLIN